MERTFLMIKPDGVERGLIGEIISRLEKRGMKLLAIKMVKPTIEHVNKHYPEDEAWVRRLGDKGFDTFRALGIDPREVMGTDDNLKAGEQVREWLIEYMTEAPVVPMVVEGIHAVEMVRKIVGHTLPYKAEIGTIRGDFSVDSPASANVQKRSIKNLVHASETADEAKHEISHWFSEEEIFEWERPDHKAMY